LVAKTIDGGSVEIPFPPDHPLPLVYKDDAVKLFVDVLKTDQLAHHSYNTGCYSITPRELAETVETEVGGSVYCDEDAPPAPFVDDLSCQRAADEFDYSIRSIEDAIERNVEALANS
jgi:nucleoside-diphosphate-sugar epimerase